MSRRRVASRSGQALVFGLVSALGLAGCTKGAAPPFERPPAPVSVVAAVTRDVPIYLDSIGKVVPRELVSIQSQVAGRITEILFKDGAELKAGDALFTIDPRPYQAQLHQAEANLAQARAALDLGKTEFGRAEELIQAKVLSKDDYDTRKNAVEVAEAQSKQNEAAVETARLNLEYCSIRSPINGRAGQRLVDLGNVVAPNSGPLLTIERLDPIYADFTVAENDLTVVQKNMAQGVLKAEVSLPDDTEKPRTGDLTFLDSAVQDTTGTVKLRATIPNGDRHFWPGRFVKIRLILSRRAGAVLVPATAPQMSAKGPFVYVVKDDSTAELRLVTPGQRQGALVVIDQGLKGGERVVVAGQVGITPGGKVHIEEPSTATSEAAKPEAES
jgi:multidrug efflux system membrane fusion protein